MKKIAIDVTPLAYAPQSGTGVYVQNVIRGMLAIGGVELHLISSRPCELGWANQAVHWFGKGKLSPHSLLWWKISGSSILKKSFPMFFCIRNQIRRKGK